MLKKAINMYNGRSAIVTRGIKYNPTSEMVRETWLRNLGTTVPGKIQYIGWLDLLYQQVLG